jgi:ABC-2 type transport system ATP-binding protein
MLVANELRKRFGDVTALDGCSLSARPGRVLGFLGANGAGKTTAMRAVFGLVELDDGSVTWEGEPIGPHQRVRFGYMPEERGLYPRMPVAEQLIYLARLHGLEDDAAEQATRRRLEDVGLVERAGDALQDLSHGNQQRVQLAAAVVHDPDLLVLDEPFSGLDPLGVESMERVLRREAERGVAIVFSSHQLDLVESLCEDVVIAHRGRDVLSGELDELREGSERRHVEVAFADGNGWRPERAVPGAELTGTAPGGRMSLSVPADLDPERVLEAAGEAGDVRAFVFQPPRLSELFQEAVSA